MIAPDRQELSNGPEFHSRLPLVYIPDVTPVVKDSMLLGKKGLGLVTLSELQLPVPPYFVLTTEAWRQWDAVRHVPDDVWNSALMGIATLEQHTGTELGNAKQPLFLSVRSGAPESMPGALETIINIGLNDQTINALAAQIGEEQAWKAYCELVKQFGVKVCGMKKEMFEELYAKTIVSDVTKETMILQHKRVTDASKSLMFGMGHTFPDSPRMQVKQAINAVFQSWYSPTATLCREKSHIPNELGTAITIELMAWGNSEKSGAGTGVLFTKNPKDYTDAVLVFKPHAQGPEIVGDQRFTNNQENTSFNKLEPHFRKELRVVLNIVQSATTKPQEVEFTVDGNQLWVLQTREVPLSNLAWFRHLQQCVNKGSLSEIDAIKSIPALQLQQLLKPGLNTTALERARKRRRLVGKGISLSPGWSAGTIVRSVEQAKHIKPKQAILAASISQEDLLTLPSNIVGVLPENGSIGSHTARIATKLGTKGIACVYGVNLSHVAKNEFVTIDGYSGEIFRGKVASFSETTILGLREAKKARDWLQGRLDNPWKYVTPENGIDPYTLRGLQALGAAKRKYKSPKAHATEVVNALIPEDIRMHYTVLPAQETASIKDLLYKIIASGYDATVRSCLFPDVRGASPYAVITTKEQIDDFFVNPQYSPKHGGYPAWIQKPNLTEVLVGQIPKDKLNNDPSIKSQHCAWTVSATANSEVVLQIIPFTPHLRDHEQAKPEEIITASFQYDPSSVTGLRRQNLQFGLQCIRNIRAYTFLDPVVESFFQWWQEAKIAQRLAAAGEIFTAKKFYPPVLEGQARLDESGKLLWCSIYGMKIDEILKMPVEE